MVVNYWRKKTKPINTTGEDLETVASYRYLLLTFTHKNDKLDSRTNSDVVYKKWATGLFLGEAQIL